MKFINKILVLSSMIFLCTSCVEEYWPELNESNEGTIVIEGRITNLDGPYTVKISQALSFQDPTYRPHVGAVVEIVDDAGAAERLTEVLPGTYQSGPTFKGVIGRKYKLEITTQNGKEYESGFEELLAPVNIEKVEAVQESRIVDETLGTTTEGYQFYVSSADFNEGKNYFYWEMIETYEYHADYKIEYYYEGVRDYDSKGPENLLEATPFHNSLFDCWATDTVKQYFTFTTDQSNLNKVDNKPLHFMEFEDQKLRFGYSLETFQYRINESAYYFLKGLEEQNSNGSNFYTTQPYQIVGNISCITNPEEVALGYFMAVGASEPKRMHTARPPGSVVEDDSWEITCGNAIYNAFVARLTNYIDRSNESHWPIYVGTILVPSGEGVLVLVPTPAALAYPCVDCRKKGGVKDKPSFWIDSEVEN